MVQARCDEDRKTEVIAPPKNDEHTVETEPPNFVNQPIVAEVGYSECSMHTFTELQGLIAWTPFEDACLRTAMKSQNQSCLEYTVDWTGVSFALKTGRRPTECKDRWG